MPKPHEPMPPKKMPHMLWLYGVVGDQITATGVRAELAKRPDGAEVVARVHSPGGSVIEALAIYQLLKDVGATVQVDGLAASAASVLAMGGARLRMAKPAMLMVHRPYMLTQGNAAQLQNDAKALEQFEAAVLSAYTGKGLDPAVARAAMDAETWYTSDEAMKARLADEVLDGPTPDARFDLTSFLKTPGVAMAAWGNPSTTPHKEPIMASLKKMLALIGVKLADGESEEQADARLTALQAAFPNDLETVKASFAAGHDVAHAVAALKAAHATALADVQAKADAAVKAANDASAKAQDDAAKAVAAAEAKVKALAPGLAHNAKAAAQSIAADAAAFWPAVEAKTKEGKMSKDDAILAVREENPAAYQAMLAAAPQVPHKA